MIVKVYAKSAVDLQSKNATYACMLTSEYGPFEHVAPLKKPAKTLTQADCAAYVNALHYLANMPCVSEIEVIEVYTDSGTVSDLIEFYKYQKHCDDIAQQWRDVIKPKFKALQRIKIVKAAKTVKAGDIAAYNLKKCSIAASDRLGKIKEILK